MFRIRAGCLGLLMFKPFFSLGDLRDEISRDLLMTNTRSQEDTTARSELEAHNESIWFVVKIARAERLCFAKPTGDHDRATTVPGDCSSPMEKSSRLERSCGSHSSNVKELTLKLSCIHGSRSDACCRYLP